MTIDEVKEYLTPDTNICLNPSHSATISAMKSRFGIDVEIPSSPPRVNLFVGDQLVVMSVRGLPRLTDRHEYTEDEIASASFSFAFWEIVTAVVD